MLKTCHVDFHSISWQTLWCCTCERHRPKIYGFCCSYSTSPACPLAGVSRWLMTWLSGALIFGEKRHCSFVLKTCHVDFHSISWQLLLCCTCERHLPKKNEVNWKGLTIKTITQYLWKPLWCYTCERHRPKIYGFCRSHRQQLLHLATMRLNHICHIFSAFSLSVSALTTNEVSTIRTKLERNVVRGSNVPTALRLSFHDCVGGLCVDYLL